MKPEEPIGNIENLTSTDLFLIERGLDTVEYSTLDLIQRGLEDARMCECGLEVQIYHFLSNVKRGISHLERIFILEDKVQKLREKVIKRGLEEQL